MMMRYCSLGMSSHIITMTRLPSLMRSRHSANHLIFSALNALIAECEKLNENDYTSESWKAFSEVLTVAIGVQVNPEATQEEIDEATADLKAAMADLVPNVDLSGLRVAIWKQKH